MSFELDRSKTSIRDIVSHARQEASTSRDAVAATATAATAVEPDAAKAAAIVTAKAKISKAGVTLKATGVDRGVIHGIGAVAANIDLDDESLRESALIDMAYDFCASKARTFKVNHGEQELPNAELVESMVGGVFITEKGSSTIRSLNVGEDVPAGATVVGIDTSKATHWHVAFRPNDDAVLETARKGGANGFSWSGFCDKVGA